MKSFLLGILEFRMSFTTRCENEYAYDLGRDLAHRLTLRYFDTPDEAPSAAPGSHREGLDR